ncbi:DUF4168 domain-containing protein [Balneolaceae bacterium ANBcel3]|nr:DUF4168 domain-containing protein [Balneolaceae bacterium ANBcel3]
MSYRWMAIAMMAFFYLFANATAHAQFEQPQQPQMQEAIEVSDEELKKFVDASISAQQIQTESQMQMMAVVEEEGLDVDTYNTIIQGMQAGETAEDMEVTSDQMDQFESAYAQIGEIEQEAETKLIAAIESEGMDIERFQQVFAAVQQSPELQQKMQQMFQEMQMQQEQ